MSQDASSPSCSKSTFYHPVRGVDGSYLLPTPHCRIKAGGAASCTTCLLCKSSKERFFLTLVGAQAPKADAKVRIRRQPTKFYRGFFAENETFSRFLTKFGDFKCKTYTKHHFLIQNTPLEIQNNLQYILQIHSVCTIFAER